MNQTETKRKQITILTYLLGMTTLLLLSGRLGDNGTAYMAAAVETYVLLYILTIRFLPEAMERLMRARMVKGQYKNVGRIFKGAVFYALGTGGVLSLAMYGISEVWMEKVLLIPHGTLVFRLLLPLYFISACSAVLKGFFQGTGTAMPSVAAHIIKYVFLLTFALMFSYIFGTYGKKVAVLLQKEEFHAMYAGAGAALGMALAGLLSLLFLLFVYLGAGRRKQQKNKEGMRMTEDYPQVLRLIGVSMLPLAGAGFLVKLPELLGLFFFQRAQEDIGRSAYSYGLFYGKYELWIFFAAALLTAGLLPLAGNAASSAKREEYKQTKEYLQSGFTWIMIWSLFLAAFFSAAAPALISGAYGKESASAASMLQFGSPVVVLLAFSSFFLSVLWESGNIRNVIFCLLSSVAVYVVVLILCLKLNGGKVENLAYAQAVFYLVICSSGGFLVYRRYKFRPDWIRGFFFPAVSALVTGIIMWLLAKAVTPAAGGLAAVFLSLFTGSLCHTVLILVLKCARERDIALMPGGKILIKAGKLLHLL